MKISVNYDLCEANGVCEEHAPDVFQLDDNDELNLLAEPDDESAPRVRKAAAGCPRAAITLTDD